jgi:two-component system cell cycle sensor histidine kinase/response regulator CckA
MIEVLAKINPLVRIVAASGMDDQKDPGRGAHPRVKKFLPKPYTTEAILHTLAEVLAAV